MKARRGLHMTFSLNPQELKKLGNQMKDLRDRSDEFVERINQLLHTFPRSLYLVFRSVSLTNCVFCTKSVQVSMHG